MSITPEHLRNELKSLQAQHANALVVAQQAIGAMALIESLLALMEPKAMTLEELRDGLGAKSAEIVTLERGGNSPAHHQGQHHEHSAA